MADLKRLQFVAQGASSATSTANYWYSGAKARLVPTSLKPKLEATESWAAQKSAPLVDQASSLLKATDEKVDASIKAALASYTANSEFLAQAVEKQRAAQAANLETFNAARQEYLHKVEESLAFVKEQGLQGAAKAASETLMVKVQEAKKVPAILLGEIDKAWHQLLALPPVAALLEGSKKQVSAAWSTYMRTHDAVVTSPTYSKAVERGTDVLKSVQATTLYQMGSTRLYPIAKPYLQPALEAATPYIDRVATHLAPAVTAA